MSDRQQRSDSTDRRSVDIDKKKASPVILSSLLGTTEPAIDKYRQKGLLPQNTDASITECVAFYSNRMRELTSGVVGDMAEQAMEADTRLKISRTEGNYLDQKIKRKEFIEVTELQFLFLPVFEHIQEQLHNLARDFPEVTKQVASMTKSWNKLGQDIVRYARKDEEDFVTYNMEKEIHGSSKLEDIKELFGLGDPV